MTDDRLYDHELEQFSMLVYARDKASPSPQHFEVDFVPTFCLDARVVKHPSSTVHYCSAVICTMCSTNSMNTTSRRDDNDDKGDSDDRVRANQDDQHNNYVDVHIDVIDVADKDHFVETTSQQRQQEAPKRRRLKREKNGEYPFDTIPKMKNTHYVIPSSSSKAKQRHSHRRHENGKNSIGSGSGLEALLPSFVGVAVLVFAVLAQRGFRGRASVAGIDLGTTNSVICIQALTKGEGVGNIDCIPDSNGSPIIPSVVSFLPPKDRPIGPSTKTPTKLYPHPSQVLVGYQAKPRIDSHPHSTLYHAKRVLGWKYHEPAVQELQHEVEFVISLNKTDHHDQVLFQVPYQHQHHLPHSYLDILPYHVGGYVVNHLVQLAKQYLHHGNIHAAVIAVPAKFNEQQIRETVHAFHLAGLQIQRILQEPTAAALAYGLHLKPNVEKILVYDFGGGTLDVSILHVSEGFVEVMGSDGDDRLGGADFDTAIARHFLFPHHQHGVLQLESYLITNTSTEALISQCQEKLITNNATTNYVTLCSRSSIHTLAEAMKLQLSTGNAVATAQCWALTPKHHHQQLPTEEQTNPVASYETTSTLCDSLYLHTMTLRLEDYNTLCQSLFDRSIRPIHRLLMDLSLSAQDIDEVVMVGGTTRMPQIRALVHQQFPHISALNTHIDPDLTVAYGAASVID
jgi:molecular chaperone DnaK (HSP70)